MWLCTAAKTKVISDAEIAGGVLNEAAPQFHSQCPASAESVFYPFAPPDKKDLPQRTISSTALKKEGMAWKSTYFWSFV